MTLLRRTNASKEKNRGLTPIFGKVGGRAYLIGDRVVIR